MDERASNSCAGQQKIEWLVGETIENLKDKLKETKLPSNREVLSVFLHYHLRLKNTIRQSATLASNSVMELWEAAKIPTSQNYHIKEKIRKLHCQWLGLKKNRLRNSEPQRNKRKKFVNNLDNLFDIGHANVLTLLKCRRTKSFLLAQRKRGRQEYYNQLRMRNRIAREAREKEEINEKKFPNDSTDMDDPLSGITTVKGCSSTKFKKVKNIDKFHSFTCLSDH